MRPAFAAARYISALRNRTFNDGASFTAILELEGVDTPRAPNEDVEMNARSKLKRRMASLAALPTQD